MSNITSKFEVLEEKITKCWGIFIICDIEIAMKLLFEIFNDIESLINEIHLTTKNKYTNIDVNSIYIIFIQLEEAMKNSDYCLIADLIQYEIKPVITKWREVLQV